MLAKVGDRIVVASAHVGLEERRGEIVEVIESDSGAHYRVRWSDGHESVFFPGSGSARIIPAVADRSA